MKPILAITAIATLFAIRSSAQELHTWPIISRAATLEVPVRVANMMNTCYNENSERRSYIVRWRSKEFISLVVYSNSDPADEDKYIPLPSEFRDTPTGVALPVIDAESAAAKSLSTTKRNALCSTSFALTELAKKE